MCGNRILVALTVAAGLLAASLAWADFCAGKQSGLWCNGNALVLCKTGAIASSQNCASGCQSMPVGTNDQCYAATGPCAGKQNGAWCDGSKLVQCKSNQVSSSQDCAYGCQSMPTGVADVCKGPPAQSGPCAGKADGAWCDGDKLDKCKGGAVASSQDCPSGCQSMPPGVADQCQAATQTGPCTGKLDGSWCDGDTLQSCSGGKSSASKLCTYGCQAMPPGMADQCKSAPAATGPCAGKSDGAWCDGDKLQQCKGGSSTASSACANGCQSMPAGVSDQCKPAPVATGPCTGKGDGAWCEGDSLLVCKGGQSVGSQSCGYGCQSNASGVADSCSAAPFDPTKSCAGKADGTWCNGSTLVTCQSGKVASAFVCPSDCQSMPAGVPDVCKSSGNNACTGKTDGTWCSGADVVQCGGGQIIKAVSCAKGCAQPVDGGGACKLKSAGFCSGKIDGDYCDGNVLTTCATGGAVSNFVCPSGCGGTACTSAGANGSLGVGDQGGCASFTGAIDLWQGKNLAVWNQKDFAQGLGTCPGLTIHNSGCTITSLSMLHAFLGLKRQVDGKEGNDPATENAWRSQNGGYGATSYELGGKKVSGKCLVLWGQAPGGLVPSKSHNDSASCVTPKAGQFIANALKAGMPVVAGVHWAGGDASFYGTSEDWHWVLIVGADDGGVLINDPWGGKASVHLNEGGLGKYVLDDLYVFWYAGKQPGGMAPSPVDDGEPTTEDGLPKTLEFVDETLPDAATVAVAADAGASDGTAGADTIGKGDGFAIGNTPTSSQPAGSSGCSAGGSSARDLLLLLFGFGALWRVRRRA